jgi:hypothetical protein
MRRRQMSVLEISRRLREASADWLTWGEDGLGFWHRTDAIVLTIALAALALLVLVARSIGRSMGGRGMVLPALPTPLGVGRPLLLHAPAVLFLAGLPCFALALADPYSIVVTNEDRLPGQRIGLMIDASSSMLAPFTNAARDKRTTTDGVFFRTVAAAEQFVRLRRDGDFHDLIALVEFGHQAYVITPFTNDYDNVLLSMSLIGDPAEFSLFPDSGTIIGRAIEQGTRLFKTFDFLDASGNLMVIFTDGEDARATANEGSARAVMASAVEARIPVHFVRTNFARQLGDVLSDALWIRAVERTGGRFYVASDEASLTTAIQDISRSAAGTVVRRRYTRQQPRFAIFALGAAAFWGIAVALKLTVPAFQKLT